MACHEEGASLLGSVFCCVSVLAVLVRDHKVAGIGATPL